LTRFDWQYVLKAAFEPSVLFIALVSFAAGIAAPLPSSFGLFALGALAVLVAVEYVVVVAVRFRREVKRRRAALETWRKRQHV
jgi:hypothetical protein